MLNTSVRDGYNIRLFALACCGAGALNIVRGMSGSGWSLLPSCTSAPLRFFFFSTSTLFAKDCCAGCCVALSRMARIFFIAASLSDAGSTFFEALTILGLTLSATGGRVGPGEGGLSTLSVNCFTGPFCVICGRIISSGNSFDEIIGTVVLGPSRRKYLIGISVDDEAFSSRNCWCTLFPTLFALPVIPGPGVGRIGTGWVMKW